MTHNKFELLAKELALNMMISYENLQIKDSWKSQKMETNEEQMGYRLPLLVLGQV